MRRLCSRPGCSAAATTVFGFDPGGCAVWLSVLTPDEPRDAGDLCDRHAAAMKPPRGWALDDRRAETAVTVATAVPKTRRRRARSRRERATPTPLPFDAPGAAAEPAPQRGGSDAPRSEHVAPPGAECVAATAEGWTPRFDSDDDLDGLLDAKTPLLGRAFRNVRSV